MNNNNNKKQGKIMSTCIGEVSNEGSSTDTIRVSTSMRQGENIKCVDIRNFRLYPLSGKYDNQAKATNRGVHFTLDKLPAIIGFLIDIYENEYGKKYVKGE